MRFIGSENETPNCAATRSGASSFLFTVAKHPPGYLLPLSSLSSHLQMRWQATPAVTATKKVITTSIRTPPPVAGYRWDNTKTIGFGMRSETKNDDFSRPWGLNGETVKQEPDCGSCFYLQDSWKIHS